METPLAAPDAVVGGPPDPFAPELDEAGGPGGPTTLLDELAAELAADKGRAPVVLPVPERPGWGIRVRADVQFPELQGWRRRAQRPTARGPETDQLAWSELLIGGTTLGIVRNGEDVLESGAPVTFRSAWLQRTLGVADPLEAVRKFFVVDAHLTGAALEVLRAAGWDDELRPLDPTSGS